MLFEGQVELLPYPNILICWFKVTWFNDGSNRRFQVPSEISIVNTKAGEFPDTIYNTLQAFASRLYSLYTSNMAEEAPTSEADR